MTFLNAQQLAFILDIKKQDARAKMIAAWCSANNTPVRCRRVNGKLIEDFAYPEAMAIDTLAKECNLPDLQAAVDDINQNYLNRAASKKWILCDYPEKQIAKQQEKGDQKRKIKLPPALRSMLPIATIQTIELEWETRFPEYNKLETPVEENEDSETQH